MNNTIAYCGLNCETCPIHVATLEQNQPRQKTMRTSIAEVCKEQYGMNLSPEEITDCDGCRADTGRLFPGCLSCEIRKCASHRNLETCAQCTAYACDKLNALFHRDPDAQIRLEEIRKNH